ncbi:hypothetical protein K449DRAFT_382982 [Hypoxylon sp. EC38]|nr:hypothetical protein K449DRAFT_382982 [Hypoxylon sp. EC38]
MPHSPSHGSHSRSDRPVDREPRRPKRYSLRIEFLDDDGDDVEKDRGSANHPRRSNQGTSNSRMSAGTRPEHPQETGRRSRQASVSSTTAVVGGRNPSSTSIRPLPSEQERRETTTSRGTRPSLQPGEDYVTAAELSETFNPHISMRGRDEAGLPQQFERHMSIRDRRDTGRHSSSNSYRKRGNVPYKHACTQTDIGGLEAHILFSPLYPGSIPRPIFTRSPRSGEPLSAEIIAYNNGILLGRQLASAHILQPQRRGSYAPPPPPPSVTSSSRRSDVQPPQPLSARRPSTGASPSPRSLSARDSHGQSSPSIPHHERSGVQQQPQGWHFHVPSWPSRSRSEPLPPRQSGSRSSTRSHRR